MQYARRQLVGDRVRGAPLGEAGAELAVLGEALTQAVEALGDRLALASHASGLAPVSTLMPGMIALVGEQLRERRAVGGRLADRLVEEDHAADVVGRARRW